jgi:hypothetical protein
MAVILALSIASMLETGIRADARLFPSGLRRVGCYAFWISRWHHSHGHQPDPDIHDGLPDSHRQYTIISEAIGGNTEPITWVVAVLVLC